MFRTTWDYFDRFAEFTAWLERVDRLNTHMSESLVNFVAERCGVLDALGKTTAAF
ncbi:MAG TPA: hypothetical protein VN641_07290 [Urbifossiella sp.]|nr:hypothetical protein [Urbifossiella sp.]